VGKKVCSKTWLSRLIWSAVARLRLGLTPRESGGEPVGECELQDEGATGGCCEWVSGCVGSGCGGWCWGGWG